jgi:hypothetical protein
MKFFVQSCLALSRAILSDMRVRRQWMFFLTLGVLALVFGGYFLLLGFLQQHPLLFALYLATSFGGLVFVMLFAFFDLLMVRKAYGEAKKAALEEITRGVSSPAAGHVTEEDRAGS